MVVTRSTRSRARIQVVASESSQQKSFAEGIQACPESRKECGSDDQSITESLQTDGDKRSGPRTPKTRKRKSRATASLAEITEPSTDGENSEAESNYSSVSEVQEPIVRITRRRKIIITPTAVSRVRKRTITLINEPLTEEVVSEAESHVSCISRIVPSTEVTRRRKAKSLTNLSQESDAEATADAESCSYISISEITPKRKTRNVQSKLKAEIEKKDTKVVPGNEKQIINTPVNSKDADTRQDSQLPAGFPSQINKPNFCNSEIYNDFNDDPFHKNSDQVLTVQKQTSIASLRETSSLKEDSGIIDEGKEVNGKGSQLNLSELKDTSLQSLVSQKHSTPQKKTTSEHSNLNCEAVMKSLAKTFAVVEVNRWSEKRNSTIKTSDITKFSDDDEECTRIDVSEDNSKRSENLECDTKLSKSELNTSQEIGDSVLLVLSSDESQQSENSESEEDTLCFVENSGQKESISGDSGNTSCKNAFFVIDTTPGLSADKNFYLEEEDKASEVAIEEEKEEEEDDENSEELSDNDRNEDDECSDEDDLLNNTKSKLLKLTSSSIDPGLSIKQLGGLYINFNADKLQSNKRTLTQIKEKKKNELLQKAIVTPDFEKNYCIPPYSESKRQLQKKRRKERQKTAGDGWYGMKAPELTDELKNDLKALKMRASMDPKRFYKKNDRDGFPKYFQVGTIVDNPADFYHSRIPKKQRKRTIVEELLADSEFRRYNRRKYSEIMAEKAANAAGKKFRKKKKFRN
uniref:Deoxynucleotidyltransferase terminal interacting protein 2 n=1 Tax=Sciurus vulgaris TaxID=55149 RepID=A0A8D2AD10_SCIVU